MGKEKIERPKHIHNWKESMLGIKETDLKKKNKEKSDLIKKHTRSVWLFLCKGNPSVVATIVTLESLKDIGELDFYLRTTKYAVFHWGLSHNNLKLITRLIDLLSSNHTRRAFLMIADNNYLAVKEFVNDILQLDIVADKEKIAVKCAILKKITSINPYDIYHNVIEKTVSEHKTKSPTAVLPQPFEEIVSELKKEHGTTLSSAGVSLFASPTNGNKKASSSENANPNHPGSSEVQHHQNENEHSVQNIS